MKFRLSRGATTGSGARFVAIAAALCAAVSVGTAAALGGQVTVLDARSTATTTPTALSQTIVDNARNAAVQAEADARRDWEDDAKSAYDSVADEATKIYLAATAEPRAALDATVAAANAALERARVIQTTFVPTETGGYYVTTSVVSDAAYLAFERSVNLAYFAFEAATKEESSVLSAQLRYASARYNDVIQTAIAESVQVAVTEAIAETVSLSGVSAAVAGQALQLAMETMESQIVEPEWWDRGDGSADYALPNAVTGAILEAAQTVSTAVSDAVRGTPAPAPASTRQFQTIAPPSPPVVVVYRR